MLVLTRRANQSIMIGEDIVVTVLDVRGDQVRIGIKAPRSVDVHREEVFVALQRNGGRGQFDHASDQPSDGHVEGRVEVQGDQHVIDLDSIDAIAPEPAPVVASPE